MNELPRRVRVAIALDRPRVVLIPARSLPFAFAMDKPNQWPREDGILLTTQDGEPAYFHGHTNDIYEHKGHPLPEVPDYEEEWSETGPVIERLMIAIGWSGDNVPDEKCWATVHGGPHGRGPTPLVAVCELILALEAAGQLEAML